jgi:predicted RNase H-like HicB family nuclease
MRMYTVVLEYDPGAPGYSVRVPSLTGCYSQGQTVEEALVNAREAIAGHILALDRSAPRCRLRIERPCRVMPWQRSPNQVATRAFWSAGPPHN